MTSRHETLSFPPTSVNVRAPDMIGNLIGNTPLVRLDKVVADTPGITLFAKAEFINPSGSVKDRAARAIVLDGLASGKLAPGKTLLDATSGNTGIAFAMLGAALGFPVILYLPANASIERKSMIQSYGARIVETDPLEGSDGAYLAAKAAFDADPERYFFPDQYNNPANAEAHYQTTGVEIWEQTAHSVSHFVAILGTSGTFTGTAKRLKTFNPLIRALAVQPDSPMHGIEGVKHMASTLTPGILDAGLIDETLLISTEAAYAMTRRLAREEGLHVGWSSGANVAAAANLARILPSGAVIVTILCDNGLRYASSGVWENAQ
ncbi:MAG: PLP-dependent cysteine synthase family protein [Zoogloeaceae bacterium]|jgi:cysteine synthase B|nr:PLP-dependent cysteine synthase family protein [Zoogloeaceae bacterium]